MDKTVQLSNTQEVINTPEKCLWDASRKNSVQWCRDHVEEWAQFITDVIDRACTPSVPCSITCDKLGSWFSLKRNNGIKHVEAIISAVALKRPSEDFIISDEILDTWELNQEYSDMSDIGLISTTKNAGMYLTVQNNSRMFLKSSKDVALEYIKFMKDPLHVAPKIVLMIRASVEFPNMTALINLRDALTDVSDQIVNDSMSTTYNIHNSGTHFTLDMGLSKAAEWFSGGDIVLRLSKIGGLNTIELSATW